ncbi:ankyrin [Acephala macrosclerotiorum]|nr:ankyrin [Acephala macrosclerotiorum]
MRNDTLNKFELLESDLIKLYIEILELEVELVNWASDGGIAQVFKTQERAVAWRDLVRNISTYHGTCKSTFDRCRMEIDQHGKVKKWISEYRPEQAHDDALQRTGVVQKYRTCGRWLLDDPKFTDWSSPEPTSDCRILWLRGTTGTGKSTLLARIIQWHLDRASLYPDRRFAYFYCSRGTDLNSKHSYKSVLQALLRQAAYNPMKGEISEHVLNAYINAGGDSVDLQPFSFTKCETLLHGILESGIKLRVMIDALDECDEPKELLKVLRDASRVMPGGLELLVSSRHEVRVDEKLSNAVIVDLGQSVSDSDMITYITTEVNDREEDERILKGKYPDLENRLIEILCRRAGGMFRWVQLQLSFFLKPRTPFLHPETVKRHLSQLDVSSAAVEKDLNIAYDDIFKRNTAEGTLEDYHANKIYRMLLCGKEPFSMAAITTAVAFNEDNSSGYESIDHAYIRQLTRDFIVETKRGTLEFAHVSVKDYLQGEHQSRYSDAKCHAQVARTCLKYISSQDRAAYEVALPRNVFLQYSHKFWGAHCAQLSKEDRQSHEVSKELLGWIIEGSGLTTFQDWLRVTRKFRLFSTRQLTSDSGSPIFSACYWNLVEVLEKLISADPAYNLNLNTNTSGHTLLSLAAYRGHKAVVELLLRTEKVEVDSKDDDERIPLLWASRNGHVEVVKLLLEKGATALGLRERARRDRQAAAREGSRYGSC